MVLNHVYGEVFNSGYFHSVTMVSFSVSVILVAMVLVSGVSCQAVNQRGCDCDYRVDGKCAFTLLMPSCGSGGSCGDKDKCDAGQSSAVDEVRDEVMRLQGNVSDLRDWSVNQTRIISQLQSDLILNTMAKLAELTSASGCDACDDVTEEMKAMRTDVNHAQNGVNELTEHYARLIVSFSDFKGEQEKKVKDINIRVEDVEERLTSAAARISNLEDASRGCSTKSLLISGEDNFIEDDYITASSYNDTALPSEARIKNNTGWCPGRSKWKSLSIVFQ